MIRGSGGFVLAISASLSYYSNSNSSMSLSKFPGQSVFFDRIIQIINVDEVVQVTNKFLYYFLITVFKKETESFRAGLRLRAIVEEYDFI